jgi:hypothetical protein
MRSNSELREKWKQIKRELGFDDFEPASIWGTEPSDIVRALETIKRDAVRLFFHLQPIGVMTSAADALTPFRPTDNANALYYVSHRIVPERDEFLARLAQLMIAADKAQAALPKLPTTKRGRPSDMRVRGAIFEMAILYKDSTGKKPGISRNPDGKPSGPFFGIVKAYFQTIRTRKISDEALAKAIQRTLKDMDKNKDD